MSEDAITELEQLLRDEREAIRRLDGERVLSYAQRKEALASLVSQRSGGRPREEDATRLRALVPALRHNSILLAHARNVLRDALVAAKAQLGPGLTAQARPAAAVPRILSVRG
jgi:hypothetical protein